MTNNETISSNGTTRNNVCLHSTKTFFSNLTYLHIPGGSSLICLGLVPVGESVAPSFHLDLSYISPSCLLRLSYLSLSFVLLVKDFLSG